MPPRKKNEEKPEVIDVKELPEEKSEEQLEVKPPVETPNLEIFSRIEACPFCGSHASHLTRFTIYWQCGVCKQQFIGKEIL